MLDARTVAVSTQGLALAAQTESARAARMEPSAHGVARGFATNSSESSRHSDGQPGIPEGRSKSRRVAPRLLIRLGGSLARGEQAANAVIDDLRLIRLRHGPLLAQILCGIDSARYCSGQNNV